MIRRNGSYVITREEPNRGRTHDRAHQYYTQEPTTIIERVEEVSDESSNKSSGFKWLSNSTLVPILFAIITSVGGFVFKLYDKVNTLEYKQSSIVEKMDESKKFNEEIKNSIKEVEKAQLRVNEHVSSIEQTMMELYRSSQKR